MRTPENPIADYPHRRPLGVPPRLTLAQILALDPALRRELAVARAPAARERVLPSWAEDFRDYLAPGGTDVGLPSVGETRLLVAVAALHEAWRGFGLREWDHPPRMRFYQRPQAGRPEDLRAELEWTPGGGVVAVRAGQTPLATAVAVVHEVAHAVQSHRLGGADLRRVDRDTFRRHERQARLAHEDFESYLRSRWDIVDCRLHVPRLLRWARMVLSGGRAPAYWTPPASLMTEA